MSTVVVELYEALRQAGVDDALAKGAASAVVPANALGDLATRADLKDLRIEIADLRAELIKWNVGTMIALTALCAAIVRLG